MVQSQPFTKIGLVEWLKVKALSSSPSTTHKKKKSQRGKKLIQSQRNNNKNLPEPSKRDKYLGIGRSGTVKFNSSKAILRHLAIKLPWVKDKGKILKAAREKKQG
jgi:hypothetical protein